uniref:Uncharacterized protein n=1 Tax=Plectus sambesii TaxID=2011161 RepID=A0A914XTX0_9BILA
MSESPTRPGEETFTRRSFACDRRLVSNPATDLARTLSDTAGRIDARRRRGRLFCRCRLSSAASAFHRSSCALNCPNASSVVYVRGLAYASKVGRSADDRHRTTVRRSQLCCFRRRVSEISETTAAAAVAAAALGPSTAMHSNRFCPCCRS